MVPLTIINWTPILIVAKIPPQSGVEAQSVTFEVKNICGQSSASTCRPDAPCAMEPPIPFTPTMDIQQIPMASVSCSMTSNNSGDACMSGQPQFPSECWGLSSGAFPGLVFDGIHNSGWGGGNSGTNTFVANLNNTWTVQSAGPLSWQEVNGSRHTWVGLGYDGNGSNSWWVDWTEDSCTALAYSGPVTIVGPLGVEF
jgi:hypothetical protein